MIHNPRTRRRPQRRGIALLLVLITMAAATTLVMGWLAVQDTSPLVGRNAVHAAEARCAAHAGLEFAVAIMETDAPWRTQHTDGWVIKDHALAGASVSVRLWDAIADPPKTFHADHPFIFFIRDLRSHSILFMGRVADPRP